MNEIRSCLNCQESIEGRVGKKYCNEYCKSNYNYQKNKDNEFTLFAKIDKQLKLNRRLLLAFNKAGKSTVRVSTLLDEGFNPHLFTHFWKNGKGQVYFFCYDYGFMKLMDNGKEKYLLVQWQSYMNKHGL